MQHGLHTDVSQIIAIKYYSEMHSIGTFGILELYSDADTLT